MMKNSLMKHVSFHDEKILDISTNNNDLIIIANDDLGEKYTFNIKNARIEANSLISINEIKDKIIMTMSYNETESKATYIHLELYNSTSPFYDEFYIYSNDINISKN